MAQLVVRNLEDDVKARLQRRARQHGRSTEEEVAKSCATPSRLRALRRRRSAAGSGARFAGLGLEGELPELPGEIAEPATFEE